MHRLLIVLLFASCLSKGKIENGNSVFENFYNEIEAVPKRISQITNQLTITDSISLCFSQPIELAKNQHLSKDLFDFLCHLDIINQWPIYQKSAFSPNSDNQAAFIERRKKEIQLYPYGRIQLSKGYTSYLIFAEIGIQDLYTTNQSMYLINVDTDNRLRSITKVASFFCYDGSCMCQSTFIIEDKKFLQLTKETSTDNITPSNMKSNEAEVFEFSFNSDGYLVTP